MQVPLYSNEKKNCKRSLLSDKTIRYFYHVFIPKLNNHFFFHSAKQIEKMEISSLPLHKVLHVYACLCIIIRVSMSDKVVWYTTVIILEMLFRIHVITYRYGNLHTKYALGRRSCSIEPYCEKCNVSY